MKKLLLFLLPFTLFSQDNGSEDSAHIVIKLLQSLELPNNDVAWEKAHSQYAQSLNLIRSNFLIPYLEYHNKKIENQKILMELEFKIKKEELDNLKEMNDIQKQVSEREMLIARYYHESRTCKIDGRSWFELDPLERKKHREAYIQHHTRTSKK